MRFPIAEAISAERCIDTVTNQPTPPLPDGAIVNCDAVSTYYWHAEKDGFDLRTNEFGIIKPPYPVMYFEWEIPLRGYADGAWTDRAGHFFERQAAVVFSQENDDGEGIIVLRTLASNDGCVMAMPFVAFVGYDEHGVYRQLPTPDGGEKGPKIIVLGEAAKRTRAAGAEEKVPGAVATWYNLVCLAISFMHCRGAGVDWREVPPKVATARRRRGIEGPTQYGCIKVPAGLSQTSTREDRLKATEGQIFAHWVRGHFKTYTPDAPLFGSRTGSWWWQPTIRGTGDAKHKPYEVGPPT